MLARASLSSPTLGVALKRWCRHHGLLTPDATLAVAVDGEIASIALHLHRDPGPMAELCAVSLLRNIHGLASWYVDSRVALLGAQFPLRRAAPRRGLRGAVRRTHPVRRGARRDPLRRALPEPAGAPRRSRHEPAAAARPAADGALLPARPPAGAARAPAAGQPPARRAQRQRPRRLAQHLTAHPAPATEGRRRVAAAPERRGAQTAAPANCCCAATSPSSRWPRRRGFRTRRASSGPSRAGRGSHRATSGRSESSRSCMRWNTRCTASPSNARPWPSGQ